MYEWRIVIAHEVGNSTHHSDIQWEYNDSGFAHLVLVKNQNCTPQFCGAPLGGCPDCPWSCCGGEKTGTDRRVRVCILESWSVFFPMLRSTRSSCVVSNFCYDHIHFLNFYCFFHISFLQSANYSLTSRCFQAGARPKSHALKAVPEAVGKFGQWGKLTGFGGLIALVGLAAPQALTTDFRNKSMTFSHQKYRRLKFGWS